MDIKLELSLNEVNIILNALAFRPYGEVCGVIDKIQKQGNTQLEKGE